MLDSPMDIFWILVVAIYLVILVRFCISRFGPVKRVSAVVVHKQKVELTAPKSPSGKVVRYAVTFQFGDKRKSFYVSELSYQGYRKGEKGTLTYRGDRLIDFQ